MLRTRTKVGPEHKQVVRPLKALVVVGTRPEVVKMASLVDGCKAAGIGVEVVDVGQHYDWRMSGQFMEELDFPRPNYRLNIGSGSHATQTSAALIALERLIVRSVPRCVIVEGDTNTALAGALASAKLQVPVLHVEAGLRSYDLRMPEEHNRRIVDHLSELLFAPTSHAAETLRGENVWGKIFVTGNTVIDACIRFMKTAKSRSDVLNKLKFDRFTLCTFHRAENVDDQSTLCNIVKVLVGCPNPVVFPVHPRTMQRLKSSNLIASLRRSKNIQLLPPVGYFDFLTLMSSCDFLLTDSGGIQEEATAPSIRKFVFVLRHRTDRPESVEAGFAKVVGTSNVRSILRSIKQFDGRDSLPTKSPYGDGRAGLRIAHIIAKDFAQDP